MSLSISLALCTSPFTTNSEHSIAAFKTATAVHIARDLAPHTLCPDLRIFCLLLQEEGFCFLLFSHHKKGTDLFEPKSITQLGNHYRIISIFKDQKGAAYLKIIMHLKIHADTEIST